MSMRLVLPLAVILALPAPGRGQAVVRDAEVARGMGQVEEGAYEAAILTLDPAVRKLARGRARSAELGRAYLYLGVAYFQAGQPSRARVQFREALVHAPDLDPDPVRLPRPALDAFAKIKAESRGLASGASEPGLGSKLPLVLGGLAVAGGGAALAASSKGDEGPDDGSRQQDVYLSEVITPGTERPYLVHPAAAGPLVATVTWQQAEAELAVSIASLANPSQVLATGTRFGSTELQLQVAVTAQGYRITVAHPATRGIPVVATYTLVIRYP